MEPGVTIDCAGIESEISYMQGKCLAHCIFSPAMKFVFSFSKSISGRTGAYGVVLGIKPKAFHMQGVSFNT